MLIFPFFIFLLYFSFSKQNIGCDDISTMSDTYKTLSNCNNYEVEENMNCCVGVISIMGKNTYFCQSFNKSATEKDITYEMNKKRKEYEDRFLGAVIKVKASCKEDVTPFMDTNCNINDSQNSSNFNNCSVFKKEKDENFCCLFSGNVLFDNEKQEVEFCYEVNKKEAIDMDAVAKDIDSWNRMVDIKYLNCSPEIPVDPPEKNSKHIKYPNFLILLILVSSLLF